MAYQIVLGVLVAYGLPLFVINFIILMRPNRSTTRDLTFGESLFVPLFFPTIVVDLFGLDWPLWQKISPLLCFLGVFFSEMLIFSRSLFEWTSFVVFAAIFYIWYVIARAARRN